MLDIILDLLGYHAIDAAVETASAKKLRWHHKILAFILILISLAIIAIGALILTLWLG